MSPTDSYRNITRFTYDNTAFQGWRLAICRCGNRFTSYFSDRQYGDSSSSLKAAVAMRDQILMVLDRTPNQSERIFERFKKKKKKPKKYPVGLRPRRNSKNQADS